MLQFTGDTEEGHVSAATCGTFNLEVIAIVHPEPLETFNEKEVDSCVLVILPEMHTKPDRTSPITVTAKHATLGIRRPILNLVLQIIDLVRVRLAKRSRRMFLRQSI